VRDAFITVADQLVREDAITRLSHNEVAGASATQYFVYFVDGGYATVSEVEYHSVKKRFDPPRSRGKSKQANGA